MSHPDNCRAHAQHLRDRAAVLWTGDEEAQQHAYQLDLEADEIDHLTSLPAPDEEPR